MNTKNHGFATKAVVRALIFTSCFFLHYASWAAGIDSVINNQPIAASDVATTEQNRSVDINVLCNDSDPDGDPITIVAVTPAIHGTIKLLANGIRYMPETSFTGTDSFTYTIGDGKLLSASATVVITVAIASTSQNDAHTGFSSAMWGFE